MNQTHELNQEPVKLCCSCGEPLEVIYWEGQWRLAHFSTYCGPIISHADFAKVLTEYQGLAKNNFEKYKGFCDTTVKWNQNRECEAVNV